MNAQIVNTEQSKAWNGIDAEHWTKYEDQYNRAPARHYAHMREAFGIKAADRVLDIGCGCGESSRDAARSASAGSVVGIDLSLPMLERARQRAKEQGLTNVTFEEIDAQAHPFKDGEFDVVISRFGSMFFADRDAAFRNIHRAMKPGGRLVLLTWQGPDKNEWLREIQGAMGLARTSPPAPQPPAPPAQGGPSPIALSDPKYVRELLSGAGFNDVKLEGHEEPMWLGPNADAAYEWMSTSGLVLSTLEDADEAAGQRALRALRASFDAHAGSDGVTYASGTWVITARA